MADMVCFIAIVDFPDGEHLLTGFSDSLHTARKHVDGYILNRRRADIPDEKVQLKSIRLVRPDQRIAEVEKEAQRIKEKYPDRQPLDEMFDTPNRILSTRVTPDPEV